MPVHTCDFNTWRMDTGVAEIQGHPVLNREFEVNRGYMELCLKKAKIQQNHLNNFYVITFTSPIRC